MSGANDSAQLSEWKRRLGLTNRQSPELYESAEAVHNVPHASAIRAALDQMGLTAVFCVQGVPTVAILAMEHYDREAIINLHGELWNQGLASLLLVISEDTLRVFSLARTPIRDPGDSFETRCLIETLRQTDDVLRFRDLIYGAESGRFWRDHGDYFRPRERVDQVLLENLQAAHELLQSEDLSPDAAQALLIQVMFIAYLEDRKILLPEDFESATDGGMQSFSAILAAGDVSSLRSLFRTLQSDFNGDLFVAPCSFESNIQAPEITSNRLLKNEARLVDCG
jgi:hypothetical protein